MAKPRFGIAITALPQLHLGESITALETAGVDEWHLDLSDGDFHPVLTGSIELAGEIAAASKLPLYVHLRTNRPERFLERLAATGCRGITVPIEACPHADRTLHQIRDLGKEAGVSLCASSALTRLEYVLPIVSRVVVLASEPNHKGGENFIETAGERVRILAENMRYRESSATLHAAGALNAERAARLHRFGATVLTLGREALGKDPAASWPAFVDAFASQRHTV